MSDNFKIFLEEVKNRYEIIDLTSNKVTFIYKGQEIEILEDKNDIFPINLWLNGSFGNAFKDFSEVINAFIS